MRYIFLAITFSFLAILARSQGDNRFSKLKDSLNRRAAPFQPFSKNKIHGFLPVSDLRNPGRLAAFIKSVTGDVQTNSSRPSSTHIQTIPLAANACKDSSFDELINIHHNAVYINSVSHTRDDGVLLCGFSFDNLQTDGSWQTKAILIKADKKGNVVWMKLFADATNPTYYEIAINTTQELANGDILATGETALINTTTFNSFYIVPVFRLDAQGNLIWIHFFKPTLTRGNNLYSVLFSHIAEGPDGALVLSGGTYSNTYDSVFSTVMKLDATGNRSWDVSFGGLHTNSYGTATMNAYIENGRVNLAMLCDISIQYDDIGFVSLDYATGDVLQKQFYKTPLSSPGLDLNNEFLRYTASSTRLNNGHYLFYGNLFSDELLNTTSINHFAVVEFDANMQPAGQGYLLGSTLPTTGGEDFIQFNENGNGLFALFHHIGTGAYDQEVYFGSLVNNQLAKLREANYFSTGLAEQGGYLGHLFSFMNDGGYVLGQSFFINALYAQSNVEFRYMHDTDTSSVCLGADTNFIFKHPYIVVPDNHFFALDTPYRNYIRDTSYPIVELDTLQWNYSNPCKDQGQCDSIRLHGKSVICWAKQPVLFSAYKSKLCGSRVLWRIDSTAVDSVSYITDSSVALYFKNKSSQAWLYSSLSVGSCSLPVIDSILLHITAATDSIHLGNDTLICTTGPFTLHAGNLYASYLWQDGSTDSVFTGTGPGTFYVSAIDYCTNHFSDTIKISVANYPLSIGKDTAICSGDTLTLSASPGFINYQWSPAYNISTGTGEWIRVHPLIDTQYTVRAEKYPGCYSNDTVRIGILHASPVSLGNDTSFCQGDSILLDAGNGFVNYRWNNGSTAASVIVKNVGTYSIVATNQDGCRSSDTVTVRQVFPLPALHLPVDSLLCANSSRKFDAGAGYRSYRWQDGSDAQTFTVRVAGRYWVQVIDSNGCAGSDTTRITGFDLDPVNFLGQDTSVCNYNANLVLQPLQTYSSYLWSTGELSSSITIHDAGTYWLTVTDQHNCPGTDSIHVAIIDCLEGAYFANAFTPNHDGYNDVFRPLLFGNVEHYRFLIYNRAGQLVFESELPGMGWDGSFSGRPQNSGTYVWSCSYKLSGQPQKNAKGFVVLIR